MRNLVTLLIMFSLMASSKGFAQKAKYPLIMKPFTIHAYSSTIHKAPRVDSKVVTTKLQGSRILVVKQVDSTWYMVQIAGINSFMKKDATEAKPEYYPYTGSSRIICHDVQALPNNAWYIPTGYRSPGIRIVSNRTFRNESMGLLGY